MMFIVFALGLTVVFFMASLFLLSYGRTLGLRYLRRKDDHSMAGLPTVEGAVFALIGLLLAFSISGGLQRFDERRQFVVQEANAVATAYERLALLEGELARDLRQKLKGYLHSRIELYRMPHNFSLWERAEVWSHEQQDKIRALKDRVWDGAVAACPRENYQPACGLVLPALGSAFEVARMRVGAAEKHPPHIVFAMLFGLGLGGSLLAGFSMAAATARS